MAAETQTPSAVYGREIQRKIPGQVYTLRLVETKDFGVIGVELTWRNDSDVREVLVSRDDVPPIHIYASHKLHQIPHRGQDRGKPPAKMIADTPGRVALLLESHGEESFFVPLNWHVDRRLAMPLPDCRLLVRPSVYVRGKTKDNVDYVLPHERFPACLITPEGLALDAVKLYETLRGGRGVVHD